MNRLTDAEIEAFALANGGKVTRIGELAEMAKVAEPVDEFEDEKAFRLSVENLFKENGWKVYHPTFSKKSEAGFPDDTFVKHRVVVAELKVGKNKPTAAQSSWLDAFQVAGVDAHLWHPSDWAEIVKVATEVPNRGR
jgi:hypothetical protein